MSRFNEDVFIEYLDELGPPDDDLYENGGRVTWEWVSSYGVWLKQNDPIAFSVALNDFNRTKFKKLG